MRTPTVGLFKRVNIDGTWRCCPVVTAANGRPKLDYVIVNGQPERHPEGSFVISWREGRKLWRKAVGKHGADAEAARQRQQALLHAQANGLAIAAQDGSSPSVQSTDASLVSERPDEQRFTPAEPLYAPAKKRPLVTAIETYLSEIKSSRTAATHAEYSLALRNFTDSCSKEYLEDIERIDMLAYAAYLRNELKVSDRTCHNRFQNVQTFLKAHGIKGLVKTRDWPRYVQEEPESYTEEELQKFFAACTPEDRVFFEFYLMTGFRKKEVVYTAWSDVDLKQGVIRVTAKPEYHFRPKDYEEREVPIPDKLVQSLREWGKDKKRNELVFPTRNGTPRKHRTQLLELCKDIAKRAGLNPDDFWLHKFRATFATMHLHAGVDLRTVQLWLGHKDLESTMRYLKPARGKAVREKVNNTFGQKAFHAATVGT